jgi:lipopolysaccharide/colanic/teichoic acid biosynthesis glycosyltransferase
MLKRTLDIVASAAVLIILSPFLLLIGLLVRLTSAGPAFYRATRTGLYGREFKLYKFRSMVIDADRRGPGITTAGDRRITPVGRILRRTKLDELPQFLNVLKGDMSIVGPRPEDPRYVTYYTPEQRAVLNVRPGITSPASVEYRNEEVMLQGQDWETTYIQKIMPAKLALDLDYAQNASVWRDIRILFVTFLSLFRLSSKGE